MVSKEEFNKVFKDTSREGILNQFYYEHIELGKMIDNFNELEKWVKSEYDRYYNDKENLVFSNVEVIDFGRVLDKLQELKGVDKE